MPDGGMALVYVTNPDRRPEVTAQLRAIFTGAEGVERVYGPDDFPSLGIPTSAMSDQAPDLVLAAAPDYMFSDGTEGAYVTSVTVGGTHGYLNSDPKMQSIFIAWGAGIPRGMRLDAISNLDIAPTVAALLGVKMPRAKGHAIKQIVGGGATR